MNETKVLPVVFVRELVVFPGMSVTLTIGREASRLAVLESLKRFESSLVTLTQIRAEDPEIKELNDVYTVGTICRVEKAVTLSDGGMQVQIEGVERFKGRALKLQDGVTLLEGESLPDTDNCSEADSDDLFERLSSYQPVHFDKIAWIEREDSDELKRINQRIAKRQQILEEASAQTRLRLLKALEENS